MLYYEFTAMNTSILLAGEGNRERVAEGFSAAEKRIRQLEQRFTRFSEDSELSALNRSAGSWFVASTDMFIVVRLAREYFSATGGLFNPGILPALEQAGYDRSMEKIRAQGELAPMQPFQHSTVPPFDAVDLDESSCAIRLPPGMRIDLGGIAKGWIAEQAAHRLAAYATACAVNAGGDMFAIGLPEGESSWPVGLEDPFHPGEDLAVLSIQPGALATSSVIRRKWQQGGQARHHLIDPRSGQPAETDFASATAISAHAAQSEVLAKALLIAGREGADGLMRRYPTAAFLAIDFDGHLFGSENIRNYYHEHIN